MTGLKAGYGEKVITPPLGVELSGYGFYLERRAASVLDDLKARAVCLEQGEDRVLFVACDLVGFTVETADAVRDRISAATKIPRPNIMLACTHTHTGPASMPLPGLGEIEPEYAAALPGAIASAAVAAARDVRAAEFSYAFETLEPIGYNRRSGNFEAVDPVLKVAYLRRDGDPIMLLGYACHAVVLGRSRAVSADWPGAAVRAAEAEGWKALLFQGFCGDIDPVTNINRWGEGTAEDLRLYGGLVAGRALKAGQSAVKPADVRLAAAEKRIRIPLDVPRRGHLDREAASFLEKNSRFPGAGEFAAAWREAAEKAREQLAAEPFLDNVPIQAIDVGGLKFIGLPGEAFASFTKNYGRAGVPVFTVGYANGDIGYLPGREAFADPGDYAAYCAPKFYSLFPFTADLEDILVKEGLALIGG